MNNFGISRREGGSLPNAAALNFPTVRWKTETATFVATDTEVTEGDNAPPQPAALVFPFYGDRIVLADIEARGWCIPSGHIEPGETPEDAVRREAWEEAGATLGRTAYLGYFVLTAENGAVRHAPTFVADVTGLGSLPEGSESRGMQFAAAEDIASLYFAWDPLLAAVFGYAWERKARLLRAGTPLRELTGE